MAEIYSQNLTHDYNGHGIYDVTFEVSKGEVVGFLGPNGAGKSTTMRHLMGFVKAQSGTASILGMDTFHKYDKIKEYVGYLPGEVNMIDSLTGTDFINIEKGLHNNIDEERINYLLKRFGLNPNIKIKRMSVGERRKLAVVIAFMPDADILLLDEPTSGLDPLMQAEFIEFIKEEKAKGKTILLSSHIFNEVEALCDRVLIIKDGKIISRVSDKDIKHGLERLHMISFSNSRDYKAFKDESKFEIRDSNDEECYICVSCPDSEINTLISGLAPYDIKSYDQKALSLEDYFMNFYKNDKRMGGL